MAAATDRELELKRCLDEAFKAFEAGQDERARRLCRQALAIDPDSSTAHSLMGLLYEREGRVGEASSEFEHVVKLSPASTAEGTTLRRLRGDEPPTPLELAPVIYEDEEEAARKVRTIAAAGSLVAVILVMLIFIGYNYIHTGHHRSGVQSASVADDLVLAGECYEKGRYQEAMAAAQRVLNTDPTNAKARQIYEWSRARLNGGATPAPNVGPAPGSAYAAGGPPPTSAPAFPAPVTGAAQPGAGAIATGPTPPSPSLGTSLPPAAPGNLGPLMPPLPSQVPPMPAAPAVVRPNPTEESQRIYGTIPWTKPEDVMPLGGQQTQDAQTQRDNGNAAPADAKPAEKPKPKIEIEVTHHNAPGSGTDNGEVKPQEETGPPPANAQPVDPAVRAAQERQRQIDEANRVRKGGQ